MDDQEINVANYGNQLERAAWFLTLFSMLTQLGNEAFPSYNVALGFWGAYCSFSRHGRATFGFITFCFFGIIFDIVFCSINGRSSTMYKFSLSMLIVCLILKVYSLYVACFFFTFIGGAASLQDDQHMSVSMYDSLHNGEEDLNTMSFSGHRANGQRRVNGSDQGQARSLGKSVGIGNNGGGNSAYSHSSSNSSSSSSRGGYYPPDSVILDSSGRGDSFSMATQEDETLQLYDREERVES